MPILVRETYDSDDVPTHQGPGTAPFRYLGRVRDEDIERTREVIYTPDGRIAGAREHLRIRRTMEPDPDVLRRLGHGPPSALTAAVQQLAMWVARLIRTLIYVIAGAFGGALVCAAALSELGVAGALLAGFAGAVVAVWVVSAWLSKE